MPWMLRDRRCELGHPALSPGCLLSSRLGGRRRPSTLCAGPSERIPVTTEHKSTISLLGLAGQLPAMLPDLPSLLRGALGLTRRPDARESIGLVFQRVAERRPDRPFLRFEGDTLSYGDANAQVNRYAGVLAQRGVQTGDVVGILMKNRPEALLITLAAVKLGAAAGGCSTTTSAGGRPRPQPRPARQPCARRR